MATTAPTQRGGGHGSADLPGGDHRGAPGAPDEPADVPDAPADAGQREGADAGKREGADAGQREERGRSSGQRKRKGSPDQPPPLPEPLRVPVADSHTHLDMQRGTVEEALAAATSVGVTTVVQVGCDLAGSRWAARVAGAYDRVWATVALHPNEAPRIVHGDPDGWSRQGAREPGGEVALDAALAEIDALAALEQVRGVGETGLDYFRTGPEGVAAQQRSFRRHLDIAKRHGKALVIHDRDAHDDVLRILAEEGAPDTVVFHCYSGDAAMAEVCAERGYYLSFAGNVTFKNAQPLRDALAVAPPDRILVETDAPFLTPAPYRGRPNAPYLIPVTLRAMAAVRGVDEDTLAAAVAANTARAFGYPQPPAPDRPTG